MTSCHNCHNDTSGVNKNLSVSINGQSTSTLVSFGLFSPQISQYLGEISCYVMMTSLTSSDDDILTALNQVSAIAATLAISEQSVVYNSVALNLTAQSLSGVNITLSTGDVSVILPAAVQTSQSAAAVIYSTIVNPMSSLDPSTVT